MCTFAVSICGVSQWGEYCRGYSNTVFHVSTIFELSTSLFSSCLWNPFLFQGVNILTGPELPSQVVIVIGVPSRDVFVMIFYSSPFILVVLQDSWSSDSSPRLAFFLLAFIVVSGIMKNSYNE